MRSLVVALFLGLVAATVPHHASALQVDITYQLDSSGPRANTTSYLGGNLPTGGTAKVRWSVTSTYGVFTPGPGKVISLNITSTLGGGFSLAVTPWAWATNYVYTPPASNYATGAVIPHPQFPATTLGGGLALVKAYATGAFEFYGRYGFPSGDDLRVFGAEVSRAVPEPSTASLLVLGLCGVAAAGRTVWRRKGRRSA
jgi:hypothetical protein